MDLLIVLIAYYTCEEVKTMDKIVYSVEEVAKILGISKSFCYKMIGEKKIPATKIGRRIVVSVSKLNEFIER